MAERTKRRRRSLESRNTVWLGFVAIAVVATLIGALLL
ncbi:MAG TPA: mammalian cell entry protein, partial [Mycobacterium sp.]